MNFPSQILFNHINVSEQLYWRKIIWLLPFYMTVVAYCYYEKVRRTMCNVIASYLLKDKIRCSSSVLPVMYYDPIFTFISHQYLCSTEFWFENWLELVFQSVSFSQSVILKFWFIWSSISWCTIFAIFSLLNIK